MTEELGYGTYLYTAKSWGPVIGSLAVGVTLAGIGTFAGIKNPMLRDGVFWIGLFLTASGIGGAIYLLTN